MRRSNSSASTGARDGRCRAPSLAAGSAEKLPRRRNLSSELKPTSSTSLCASTLWGAVQKQPK
eukprot:6386461-Pyramimonas_sp.AAC.1